MNELAYNLLLDKTTKRQVDILLLLIDSHDFLPLVTIASTLNSSIKTIKKDCIQITDSLNINLSYSTYLGTYSVRLSETTEITYDCIKQLVDKSPLSIIIKEIFTNGSETIPSLIEKCFIVESTLRKYLTHLKKILNNYDLSIKLTPVEIVGNEADIRYFYFKYFEYHSPTYLTELTNEAQSEGYAFIQSLTIHYSRNLEIDYQRFIQWLSIIRHRITLNNYIILEDTFREQFTHHHHFVFLVESLLRSANHYFPTDITEEEIIYIYIILLESIIYGEVDYFFENEAIDTIESFSSLTSEFFESSNLNFSTNLDLKMRLQIFLTNLTTLTSVSPLFQKNEDRLNKIIESEQPLIFQKWLSLISRHSLYTYPRDVATSLTIITASSIIKRKRVLICLTGSSSSVSYYRALIKQAISSDVEIIWAPNQVIDDDFILQKNVDLCITNYETNNNLTSCLFFQLSIYPSKKELDYISYLLSQ